MATISELKEIIVDLKMRLVKNIIPYGNCPYAYYLTKERENIQCGTIGCYECENNFYDKMKKIIEQEVAEL